ncbi:MAG: cytochrome b [Paracoccaceae bacterium]
MSEATGYTRMQIRLHWLVMVFVILQYALHEGIAEAFDAGLDAGRMTLDVGAVGHMGLGLLILLLVFWRIALRQEHGAPPPPAAEPAWAKLAAKATHHAFYALLIALPITGGLAWGMASETLGDVHEVLRALLLLLILLHVGAVAVHQLVWKTDLLTRMRSPVD